MMKKLDLETPKNREKALADFKSLLDHPGWNLVKAIVNENMEALKDMILTGIETGEELNRMRDRLKAYKDIINTPEHMIEKLGPIDVVEPFNDDPYTETA